MNPLVLVALIVVSFIGGSYLLSENQPNSKPSPIFSDIYKASPSPLATLNPIFTDEQLFEMTQNSLVDCEIDSKCGGGTRRMKSSACQITKCCKIGDNYVFYDDFNQCYADQLKHNLTELDSKKLELPTIRPISTINYTPSTPLPIQPIILTQPTPTNQQLYNDCKDQAIVKKNNALTKLYAGGIGSGSADDLINAQYIADMEYCYNSYIKGTDLE